MDVGLARVSTLDQDPRLQIAALKRDGCDPILEERVSGAASRRPVRDEALELVQRGDTLVVWKLDRLGRSLTELQQILADLEARGVKFRSLTEHIDTSTAQGRLFFLLLAAFAEFERELIRERTRAGKERQRAEGRPMGPLVFGWTDANTVNEDQAALLREAARRILDDHDPTSRVVDDWNARDLRPGKAARWRVTHLRRILLNERTAAIIGRKRYDELHRLFGQPDRQKLGRPAEHLLSGILRCGRDGCGQPLYAATKGGKDQPPQLVYRCKKGAGSGGRFAGCGATVVSLHRADAWAEDAFVVAVAGPTLHGRIQARLEALGTGGPSVAELAAEREELGELELILRTRWATDDHRARRDELRARARAAQARTAARPDLAALATLPQTEEQLRERWAGWTTAKRRIWLRRLLHSVIVLPATQRSRASDVARRLDPQWRV